MTTEFTACARRLGMWSAAGIVALSVAYVATLTTGLLALPSSREPITGPVFATLEILILVTVPLYITLMVSVHAWAAPSVKVFSLVAIVFMSMLAAVTSCVHFVILTLGGHAEFSGPSSQSILSFRWPSIVYALEILAWDVFFALAVLFAAAVFAGSRIAKTIRALLVVSGVLALAGLSGVALDDMRLRNIGIAGYAAVFPIAALLLAIMFKRAVPSPSAPASDRTA